MREEWFLKLFFTTRLMQNISPLFLCLVPYLPISIQPDRFLGKAIQVIFHIPAPSSVNRHRFCTYSGSNRGSTRLHRINKLAFNPCSKWNRSNTHLIGCQCFTSILRSSFYQKIFFGLMELINLFTGVRTVDM